METEAGAQTRNRTNVSAIISYVLIFGTIIIGACYWCFNITDYLYFPGQIEYTEGFMRYNGQLFASGQWVYDPSVGPPYALPYYPPIYYWIYAGAINVFGDSWVLGRVIVLLFACTGMFFVFQIVYHVTKNQTIALIGALLPLTQPLFITWSMANRVDVPAATFEIIGVYLFLKGWDKKSTNYYAISVFVFLIAFFTKQSMIAGAIACTSFLLLKDWRRGLDYGLALIINLSILIIPITIITHGYFFKELFTYQQTMPTYKPVPELMSLILVTYLPLTFLIVLAIRRFMQYKLDIISIYFIVAMTINLVMLGRQGGSTNYAIQLVFAICCAGALQLPKFLAQKWQIVTVLIGWAVFMLVTHSGYMPLPDDKNYIARIQQVKTIIADADYPILTENAGVVLDAGKKPYYENFSFTQLQKFGYWDNSRLLSDLNTKRIPYVISEQPIKVEESMRYTTEVQEAILANYELIYNDGPKWSTFRMAVYKPKE